jgi:hypothetical protein
MTRRANSCVLNLPWLTLDPLVTQRQSLGDKAGAALKPNEEKSYVEQAGDQVKGVL